MEVQTSHWYYSEAFVNTQQVHMQKWTLISTYLTHILKVTQKCIKDLNVSTKIIKFLEENWYSLFIAFITI